MTESEAGIRWTENDIKARLEEVRETLLSFLNARKRFDWFKQKTRWRLSRQYIWPGSGPELHRALNQAVEEDGGVSAFLDHIESKKVEISRAIERYNHVLKRWMEQDLDRKVHQFDPESRRKLKWQRITFEGMHDELYHRGRRLEPISGPELLSELLSLRVAILDEEGRAALFAQVAGKLALDKADSREDVSPEERKFWAWEFEQRLRTLDRYYVVKLFADTYEEAKRLTGFDEQFKQFSEDLASSRTGDTSDRFLPDRLRVWRQVLEQHLGFFEEKFPNLKGTHERQWHALRESPKS